MFTTRNSFMAASGTLVGMAITAALLAAPLAPGYVAEDEADARQPIIVTSPQTLDLRDVMALDDLPFVQNSLGPHGVMLGEHPGHLLMMHPAQFDRNRMFRGGLFFGADHPGVYAFAHPIGDTTMQSFSESHTIEVTIKDGKTTIRLDGEEVPEDRLKRIGDHIIILDENGEEVRTITIGGGEEMLREFAPGFRIGDDAGVWRLKRDGARHPKVMLGVNLDEPDEALRYHLGLETGVTTLVPSLYKGLPAYEAGLRPYDIIVAIDGEGPADPTSLRAALADKESGDAIGLTVIQAGQRKDLTVELTAYDT